MTQLNDGWWRCWYPQCLACSGISSSKTPFYSPLRETSARRILSILGTCSQEWRNDLKTRQRWFLLSNRFDVNHRDLPPSFSLCWRRGHHLGKPQWRYPGRDLCRSSMVVSSMGFRTSNRLLSTQCLYSTWISSIASQTEFHFDESFLVCLRSGTPCKHSQKFSCVSQQLFFWVQIAFTPSLQFFGKQRSS